MSPRPDELGDGGPHGLRADLGKVRPFDSVEQRVHLGLLRAASLSEGPMNAVFRAHGLSQSAYNVLRILRAAGAGGRRAMEIAPGMVVRTPDVSRLLDRLEREGLIERTSDPSDLRLVVVKITGAGLEKVAAVEPEVLGAHDAAMGGLTDDELAALDRLLTRVREPFEGGGDGG